ncbi:MAG TPA: carboxypeptidase regulatory-like domain-containing protein, partial [Pyrinomonadaceae bacterium]|nr:carboxypeptidase regulatory-like domain-containing protein [Pyrinomonadaceae bacterium]
MRQNGGLPAPNPAPVPGLPPAPSTSLIVKWNGAAWADETGDTKWSQFVNFLLADVDLVTINAASATPALGAQVRGLGTHLGNMAFDPSAGRLYVANLESDSVRRFEPNLRGRFQTNRVSVLDATGAAPALNSVHDLNPHVDFSNPDGTDAERAQSLALPADIVRASDGTLYVAATSSAKVGVLNASGAIQSRINVGQGPTGLALDEPRERLYVLNRHAQTLSVVNTGTNAELAQTPVGFNPEPAAVRNGRRFLYDAASFSAHGTVSCASCHPGGHRDGLAWDLGDPTGGLVAINGFTHHPMKGPMTTQSLRGLLNATPLHWRADRRTVAEFNVAFTGLLGSKRLLTNEEMAAFTAFVNTLSYPPNPNQNHDRSFPNPPSGPNALTGSRRFQSAPPFQPIFLGGVSNCNTCHQTLTPFPHTFGIGSDRLTFPGSILNEPQAFKVPQLRGIYQKVGMRREAGEQLTGFGFIHDGSFDTLLNFMRHPSFVGFNNDDERRDIEAFLLSVDSTIAPAVGLQVTVNAENKNSPDVLARVQLLVQQAQQVAFGNSLFGPGCDLVVRGIYGGGRRGFLMVGNGIFQPDSRAEGTVNLQQLLAAVAPGAELTFTGVPVGEGRRFALDRNGDNVFNDDEQRASVQISGRVVNASGEGVAGVAVRLSGAQTAVAQTDSTGRFVFGNVSTSGAHTVTPSAGGGVTFSPASRTFTNPALNQDTLFVTPSDAPNAIDAAQFFVRQQYRDFLNREADAEGLAFWTNQITSCGANANCVTGQRENVSGAFYLSIEFQETGFLVYRLTEASFNRMPAFADFFPDQQRLGASVVVGQNDWEAQLARNKAAFLSAWVARPAFRALFDSKTNEQYVDTLVANAGITPAQAGRDALVTALNTGAKTRAVVLG